MGQKKPATDDVKTAVETDAAKGADASKDKVTTETELLETSAGSDQDACASKPKAAPAKEQKA